MDSSIQTAAYAELLSTIKARIASAQYAALKVVNKELISMYWDIGRFITERQQSEGWGKSVVEHLAKDLQSAYPGARGYSSASLWRMRSFYETYARNEKLAPLVREIAWSQYRLEVDGREFFIDILLYHRHMKCLVAIELKVGDFKPEYVGKMQFYLRALDVQVRLPEEKPTAKSTLSQWLPSSQQAILGLGFLAISGLFAYSALRKGSTSAPTVPTKGLAPG